MTLNEEIIYGKKEKEFNLKVQNLLEKINEKSNIDCKNLEEKDYNMIKVLNIKHSEPAEMIREANYSYVLDKILKEGFSNDEKYFLSNILDHQIDDSTKSNFYKEVSMLREFIDTNLNKINSDNLPTLMEGYSNLSEVYVLFESTREI